MKVFLVDDNTTALKMLALACSKAGYKVGVARSGTEALKKIPAEKPDIIVMDVMMPNMDGIEATRQLRANPDTAHIPVMLLTARDRLEDKLTGFGVGADDYVVKPVMPAELIARIGALFRRTTRQAEAAPTQRGRVVGLIGVKGGVGTTTLAVNMAIAWAQDGKNVILADLHPWNGATALHMGLEPRAQVALLAEQEPHQITRRSVEDHLERHDSGVWLFAIPRQDTARIGDLSPEQIAAIIDRMETLADVVVLDLGCSLTPTASEAMQKCYSTILVLEADSVALTLASDLTKRLRETGLVGSRIGLVMVNRARSASTYTQNEIETLLGSKLRALITPAPEIAFHATKTGIPVLLGNPNAVMATQLRKLSSDIL